MCEESQECVLGSMGLNSGLLNKGYKANRRLSLLEGVKEKRSGFEHPGGGDSGH